MSARPNQPIKVFISYSRKDEQQCEELIGHLAAMRKEGLIEVWHDPKIVPGAEWDATIKRELDAARLILFLVSSRFMDSEYCCKTEIPRAMQRHVAKEASVVPILLESVDFGTNCLFTHLQMLPSKGVPINKWPQPSDAFVNIVSELRRTVEELLQPSADDLWYEDLRKANCDSLIELLQSKEREPLRREIWKAVGAKDKAEPDLKPFCDWLCDRASGSDLPKKLLNFHRRLCDQRSNEAAIVETIVDTILPLHFDVSVLRQAYSQRNNEGRPLLVNLVTTDFGAEMLMAALAGRRAELRSLPPRKHRNSELKRIGSAHQYDYEPPAPGVPQSGDSFQQDLHDTMHHMARPFMDETEIDLLERRKTSDRNSRIAILEKVLKKEFEARVTYEQRTPFWVFVTPSDETEEDKNRRERIFQEIARRVDKIAFVELYVDDNAGEQERLFVRLLQTRFQDTKES